ncbi:MAG: hypothetical protein NPIRA01_38370 [Nitrospirales bacterium]|nr:MAG: hypothetical protein NPIRA01_38370 [Nitrospirales bacterium]
MSYNKPWEDLARELDEVMTILPNFHAHKDRDVSADTLFQRLQDYQFFNDEDPSHLRIRVQNFTRMELRLFTLVFQQWERRRGTS